MGRARSEYREDTILRCPACTAVMQTQAIERAILDVCETCGGVWADAEDGDVGTIATQVHLPELASATTLPPPTLCPRCGDALAPWAAGEVRLERCAGCRGTFLPRAAVDAAMWLPPDAGEPPRSSLAGLSAWVRRLLGRD